VLQHILRQDASSRPQNMKFEISQLLHLQRFTAKVMTRVIAFDASCWFSRCYAFVNFTDYIPDLFDQSCIERDPLAFIFHEPFFQIVELLLFRRDLPTAG